jgi:hypothetical protein
MSYRTNTPSRRTSSSNDLIPILVLLKLTPIRTPWALSRAAAEYRVAETSQQEEKFGQFSRLARCLEVALEIRRGAFSCLGR